MTSPAQRYRRYLENLAGDSLDALDRYVAPDVRFRDPFNDITGRSALRAVFAHMFATVKDLHFEVSTMMEEGQLCLMSWNLTGRLRGRPWRVEGMSRISFTDQGLVQEHIDYWDAAGQFYEHLPLLGPVIAALRRRLARASASHPL